MLSGLERLSVSSVSAFDLLPHPVWIFSLSTLRILASNGAAQNLVRAHEAVRDDLTIADFSPFSEIPEFRQRIQSLANATADIGQWDASLHWRKVSFEGTVAVLATLSNAASGRSQASTAEPAPDFRRLFEGAPGKMLVIRPGDHEILAVTDEYAAVTMTNRSDICGRKLFDVFPDNPEEPDADGVRNLKASLERVETLSEPDIMNVQRYPIRDIDGTFIERYWMAVNKPVFDEAGKLIFITHRVEDLTGLLAKDAKRLGHPEVDELQRLDAFLRFGELRSTLTGLQEKEARLRTAERLLELGPWEYDFESGAFRWSPRAFEIYGVPQHAGAPDFNSYVQLVHPDDRQQMLDNYKVFEPSGAPSIVFQHRVVRSDGTIVHVKGVGERHRVDGRDLFVGFAQDISDIVASQSKLAEMTRLQRIAGRMARLGSWRVELYPERLIWSPETVAIHEEAPDIVPTIERGINYYAPEHRERIRSAFLECVKTGASIDEILQLQTAKGNRIWVHAIGEAVWGDNGAVVAIEGAFQDISELVAARDQADDLARRLHQTLENISDAFFLIDTEWRFAFLNSQAETLLQREREGLLGKVIWEEFPPAAGSTFQKQYERAVRERQSVRFDEYFEPLKSWFAVDAYPTSEGLAVYFHDVTASRARDEHLRLLEAAVSRQNDILLITEAEPIEGPDGPRIIYVNDAFVSRTGYAREEVIGRTPRLLQGPKTQKAELSRIRTALEQWKPVRAELINYTKTGEEFWLELDIVPLADDTGRYTHWVAVERDITERTRNQEALQINDERFRLVAMATNDVIWDWDLVESTIWWNENLKGLCGYEPAEVEPGPESWTSRIHPEDRDRVLEEIHAVIDGSGIHWTSEYRFIHRNGHALFVVDRGFVIRNDAGKPVRMIGSMLDVTKQRGLEDTLRQAQKLEAVGQLTGGVAHDFNNLLTVIIGNSEILHEELESKPTLQRLAEMSMKAAHRGADLTRRLLAFARKQALEPSVVNVDELVAGIETLLHRTLGEEIDITFKSARGLWNTEVDASQLETALLNLAINARDAMPDGGRLTIETANATFDRDEAASAQDIHPGQYVVLTVTDTGHGISRDIMDHVFEPFFTTKETGKGSGLGLSMVHGFVNQSGGHVRIHSEPGEGTSIKLYFPRSLGRPRITADAKANMPAARGNERILVVEDDALVRQHLVSQLEGLGYRVVCASSGQRALEIIQNAPDIDLLLTDVVMPGMNGNSLANKAMMLRPDLKILFTSGYSDKFLVEDGRLRPGIDLLRKPYSRDHLADKLRETLG